MINQESRIRLDDSTVKSWVPNLHAQGAETGNWATSSSMTDKHLREIAALEIELAMTEAHARKLYAASLNGSDEENPMAALLQEENVRAEELRQKIRVLRNDL